MPNLDGFGARLKSAITQSKYTQKDISEFFKISQDTITNYIKEKSFPKIDFLFSLCDLINISLEWLLTGEDPVNNQLLSTSLEKLTDDELKVLQLFRLLSKNDEIKNIIETLTDEEINVIKLYRQLGEKEQHQIEGMLELKVSEYQSTSTSQDDEKLA